MATLAERCGRLWCNLRPFGKANSKLLNCPQLGIIHPSGKNLGVSNLFGLDKIPRFPRTNPELFNEVCLEGPILDANFRPKCFMWVLAVLKEVNGQ